MSGKPKQARLRLKVRQMIGKLIAEGYSKRDAIEEAKRRLIARGQVPPRVDCSQQ
jgi:hypothetical protein